MGDDRKDLSSREIFTVIHGMGFGAAFLLGYAAAWTMFASLRDEWLTSEGSHVRVRRLNAVSWSLAAVSWVTVASGTFQVYPWYRATPSKQENRLAAYPQAWLLADERSRKWHEFAMEWKEHIGWIAPIVSTAVALAVTTSGDALPRLPRERRAIESLHHVGLLSAAVAGGLGALINKVAPMTPRERNEKR